VTLRLEYHTLDVFTDRVFGGNPLAVFPDGRGLAPALMQSIARELNLSETVFVLPAWDPAATRRVRIFTPAQEVPFAGHPTLGTAFFLVASGILPVDVDAATVVLEEDVGLVPVDVRMEDGRPVSACLTAAVPPSEQPADLEPAQLARMVGLDPDEVGAELDGLRTPLEPVVASAGLPFLVLPVRDVAAAERARLDTAVWESLLPEGSPSRMVYVVAPGGRGHGVDLHVRMFAPAAGVPEDPATGSAAAALAGYLGARGDDGEPSWEVEQGLEMGRPSRLTLHAAVRAGRVLSARVAGAAVMVARGTMEVPS
jgi:trans-2,3-dihydro-3-hydroxyanthranilate isomerase